MPRGFQRITIGVHDGSVTEPGDIDPAEPFVLVTYDGDVATITMNRPKRRNALSFTMLEALREAFDEVASSHATGVVLAGHGPVFSAGHDFGDIAGADETTVRRMLDTCAALMRAMQTAPQPIVARVHGLATAAGCQLVANADLAVAAEGAGFAAPGGKGGWFCHTPMVAIGRNVGRKRAMELALSGDVIDAMTAYEWGLVNAVVPDDQLDAEVTKLLARVTRGSARSKAVGKRTLYEQLSMPEQAAYEFATAVMAETSQLPDAQEGMRAFLEKRQPVWESHQPG
jgi:enoyl-CoA hydratase/carnithine racemase